MLAVAPLWWGLFVVFVLLMLALDLGVFHKQDHAPGFKEALGWTTVWATLATLFGGGVGLWLGAERMLEFYSGYVIELSLSFDNVFVFVLVFQALKIPRHLQHRVLFWGILTALVLRGVMILGGAALVARFDEVLYVFGAFLLFTAVKMLRQPGHDDPHALAAEDSRLLRWLRRRLRVTDQLHGNAFVVREDGRRRATPLLLALLMVEVSDVVFAVDSIPAIFAVTRDPFVVFTSNVFAILGLRSLFFVLAGMVDKFPHLKTGLAIVLAFVGCKLLLLDVVHVPAWLSLGVILGVLATSIVGPLLRRR